MLPERPCEGWVRLEEASSPVASKSRRPFRSKIAFVALLLLSSFVVLGFGSGGQAQAARPHKEHKRDYKREIEAVELQWKTAQLTGDVAMMDKLLAEDYFGISVAGELNNKSQQLERLRQKTLVFTKIDASDTKVKLLGGRVGVVTSLARIEATNDGAPMNGNFRYTRVYKRYPDGSWKITNFEVTKVPDQAER